jgi:hypothetical protein
LKGVKLKGRYVHYGSSEFDPVLYRPISNHGSIGTKPSGGLWASPVGSERTWKDWCEVEQFRLSGLNKWFVFELSDGAEVLEVLTGADIPKLDRYVGHTRSGGREIYSIDFEKMATDGYSAFLVMAGSDPDLYWELYGWDCDTLLVLDPECIVPCGKGGVCYGRQK